MKAAGSAVQHVFKSDESAGNVRAQYRDHLRSWPVPNEHLIVSTREGETFVVASGPKDAPAVLLLHGTMSNAAVWVREVATLAAAFRVYAVDIIGDAGLSAPSRPSFASDAHALWLGDVLAGLGVNSASLAGHSMGGGIALDFAIRFPERTEALVLLCPAGVANKSIMWWALPLLLLGPWGARRVQERLLGKLPAPESEEERQFAALSQAILKEMKPRTESFATFSDEQLGRLTMPVLVLLGGRDVTMDSGQIERRFKAQAPNAEVVVYPEARHYLGDQSVPIAGFLRRCLHAGKNSSDPSQP